MHKSKLLKLVFKIFLIVFSYGFIYYKITSSHFDLSLLFSSDIILIVFALLLMPFNWLLESLKWQYILTNVEWISLSKAYKAVFIGLSIGMATPNRVGEYLGRSILLKKENRAKGNLATVLCSWSQILATFFFGLLGWVIFFNNTKFIEVHSPLFVYRHLISIGFVFFIFFFIYLYYHLNLLERFYRWLNWGLRYIDNVRFLSRFSHKSLSNIFVLSLIRYMVFSFQYLLLLAAFGVSMPFIEAFACISVAYLFMFFIPQVALAELGVRASVAIITFSYLSTQIDAVFLAASFLWLINVALPSFVGSILWMKQKIN